MKKSDEEMRALADAVNPDESKYPGMSYEAGLRDALEWALGEMDEEEAADLERDYLGT